MKRFRLLLLCLLFGLLLPGPAAALEVVEAALTTGISGRAPIDAVQSYSAAVGTLYCFTRLAGAEPETAVTHVWYWQEREMARIELPVRAASWRTWSSKTILPDWTGPWRVDILDSQGRLLRSLAFALT